MAFTLQAIVAKTGALPPELPNGLRSAPLAAGVDLIPLGKDALKANGFPFLPLTDEGQQGLPASLAKLCEQLSAACSLAYIEAEYFGGVGTQAQALFSAGNSVGAVVISGTAINDALRYLGVDRGEAADEFEAAGLGLHRDTDGWLK